MIKYFCDNCNKEFYLTPVMTIKKLNPAKDSGDYCTECYPEIIGKIKGTSFDIWHDINLITFEIMKSADKILFVSDTGLYSLRSVDEFQYETSLVSFMKAAYKKYMLLKLGD